MWERDDCSCCAGLRDSRRLGGVLTALLLMGLLFVGPAASQAASGAALRLAILPCTDVVKTYEAFLPLAGYLEGRLGRKVELLVPKDFSEFEGFVEAGRVDFAFQAPHTYVRLANLYNRKLLVKARTPEGEVLHRGVIVVRRDSGITRIEELKGKSLLFGPKLSTAKWIAARDLLFEKGVDLNKDLKRYANGTSCEAIALQVYLKNFDAGALCDYSFAELASAENKDEDAIPVDQLVVIGRTWAMPTWVLAFRREMDPALAARVQAALLALESGRKEDMEILEPIETGGFAPALDSDYDELRQRVGQAE